MVSEFPLRKSGLMEPRKRHTSTFRRQRVVPLAQPGDPEPKQSKWLGVGALDRITGLTSEEAACGRISDHRLWPWPAISDFVNDRYLHLSVGHRVVADGRPDSG